MAYNIVTNSLVVYEVKKCRYFRTNLGLASTVDKGGNRVYNEKDQFSYFYNTQYRTTIYAQGNVGDIKFYIDHFIKDPIMAVYYGPANEEFLFDVDFKFLAEKGIDFYLGHILKEVETQFEERVKTQTEKKLEPKKTGNSEMVTFNPGAVTYEDLKAFMEKQNAERYKNNKQL
jgi:hypothetical protein